MSTITLVRSADEMIGIENEGVVRTLGALAFPVVRAILTCRPCTTRASALFGLASPIGKVLAILTLGTRCVAVFRTLGAFSRGAAFTNALL